jgi:nucleotide-binding universal stress UspA family protein
MNIRIPDRAVVVGVDGSSHADEALAWAAAEADRSDRPLVIAHATGHHRDHATLGGPTLQERRILGRRLVDRALARIWNRFPGLPVQTLVRAVDPVDLMHEAGSVAALLVVGSRGLGPVSSAVLGSVSGAVAADAPCPVVVVRGRVRDGAVEQVVAATDLTDTGEPVRAFARDRASVAGARLTLVHSWHAGAGDPPHDRLTEVVQQCLAEDPTLAVETELTHEAAGRAVVAASHRAALVVVGHSVEHVRPVSFRGESVASYVVARAGCPVAVVPTYAGVPGAADRRTVDA